MTKTTFDEMSPEDWRLNQNALGSLVGFNRDWQTNLVALLRSNAPIGWAVREEIAKAIEGTSSFGAQLTLSGHERSSRWWSSIKDRRAWFEFGPEVAPFVDDASNLPEGLEAAAEALDRSEAYCKKAYYYWRDCIAWMARARQEGRTYGGMDEGPLSLEFHIASVEQRTPKPAPMPGHEFDRWFSSRINGLKELIETFEVFDHGSWQSHALLEILYWKWRVPSSQDD